jgi:hypothetical protein
MYFNKNYIFSNRLIPDAVKTGLLSPVYKNKGDNHQSKNYREIVVLPVFAKIIEYIARTDLKPLLLQNQSVLQACKPIDIRLYDVSFCYILLYGFILGFCSSRRSYYAQMR